MSLIELIVYIGIVAIIILGSVFSAYSIMFSQDRTHAAIELINQRLR